MWPDGPRHLSPGWRCHSLELLQLRLELVHSHARIAGEETARELRTVADSLVVRIELSQQPTRHHRVVPSSELILETRQRLDVLTDIARALVRAQEFARVTHTPGKLPQRVPRFLIGRLECGNALQQPAVRARLTGLGMEPGLPATPDELAKSLRVASERQAALLKSANFKPE